MALIWIGLWRFKDKHKQNQYLATSKELICSKPLKKIKQMKRLQNLGIMDDNRIDMEDIQHQGEDEDATTIENNPSKKTKEKRIEKMLMEAMATHEFLTKNLFEIPLRKNGNLAFQNTLNSRSDCDE